MLVKDSQAQNDGRKLIVEQMKEKLGGDECLAQKLTPQWEVGCRRATPGPGYLEAFATGNAQLVMDRIQTIEPEGIRTVDGQLREFDIIVCATGFNVS